MVLSRWLMRRGGDRNQGGPEDFDPLSVDSDIVERVVLAVGVFMDNPDADQMAILSTLVARGFSREDAWRHYQFLPIAFTHAAFRNKGVRFEPGYRVMTTSDISPGERRLFSDEPIYVVGVELARQRDFNDLLPVVHHSAEWVAIQAVKWGPLLRGIRLNKPILMAFDDQWVFGDDGDHPSP